jgi:predicted enzyme related to lactoylglutathione lyase
MAAYLAFLRSGALPPERRAWPDFFLGIFWWYPRSMGANRANASIVDAPVGPTPGLRKALVPPAFNLTSHYGGGLPRGEKMNSVGLIIYPVADLAKATEFFATLLGTQPYAEGKNYVGFKTGDVEIGLVPRTAHRSPSAALAYVTVSDINEALATLIAAGAEKVQDVTDVGYGLLVASFKDLDGTPIGLRQFPKAQ